MVQTKAAANAFIDKLLTEDSTTRIAVVVFNLKVDQTGFYTWADKAELKTYINNIKKATDKYDGGTFTQLGIKTARDLLNSSASKGGNKSIVLLSDGVPTASYRVSGTATGTCQYNNSILETIGRTMTTMTRTQWWSRVVTIKTRLVMVQRKLMAVST